MTVVRSVLAFLDRYLTLAGRSCCAGRSQIGLRRSVTERTRGSAH